jgi:L-rhamnose mutarotase
MPKRSRSAGFAVIACLFLCVLVTGCGPKVRRYGSVIGLKSEKIALYNKLHADPWPEIVSKLQECNIHNYSIYQAELEKGKWYLFSYFEYTGRDFDADMKKMGDDPKTKEWWKLTEPCQIRVWGTEKGQQWLGMKEVYHSE